MKLEVTQTGIFDGKNKEIPVGSVLEVAGDTIPASYVNKVVQVDDAVEVTASDPAPDAALSDQVAITNPKK